MTPEQYKVVDALRWAENPPNANTVERTLAAEVRRLQQREADLVEGLRPFVTCYTKATLKNPSRAINIMRPASAFVRAAELVQEVGK